MNIIWKQPSGALSVTSIFDGSEPDEHAVELKDRGDIPQDWIPVSIDYQGPWPAANQDIWRWNGTAIVEGPPVVPQQIDALQGLLAIDQSGLADAYLAWASSGDRTFSQRAFIDKALLWKRDDPTIAAASTALGLTSEQVDSMFILAKGL